MTDKIETEMETIWKYKLATTDEQFIEIPTGFTPLFLDVQRPGPTPCLWCRVDPKAPKIRQKIITHGTGHPVPETTGKHVGSYMLEGGSLIFHVFLSA